MKKCFYLIALAAAVLAGCAREEGSLKPANAENGNKTVLKADFGDITKATVNEKGTTAWAADDTIGVLTPGGAFALFEITEGAGTKYATFTSLENNVTIEKLAVAPYEIAWDTDGTYLSVFMPETYEYKPGRTNAPMVATFSGADVEKLSFKHIGALLAVTYNRVPAEAVELRVTATGKRLSGEFLIDDVTAAGASMVTEDATSANTVYVQGLTPSETPVTLYVPIPAGEYPILNVRLVTADNKIVGGTQRYLSDVAANRGDMLTLNGKMKLTRMENWSIDYSRTASKSSSESDYSFKYRINYSVGEDTGKKIYMYQISENNWINKYNQDPAEVLIGSYTTVYNPGAFVYSTLDFTKSKYHILMFGVRLDEALTAAQGKDVYVPTGEYQMIETEAANADYLKWIGEWTVEGRYMTITDANPTPQYSDVTYNLKISDDVVNKSYKIGGWQNQDLRSLIYARYDAESGKMYIVAGRGRKLRTGIKYTNTETPCYWALAYWLQHKENLKTGYFGAIADDEVDVAEVSLDGDNATLTLLGTRDGYNILGLRIYAFLAEGDEIHKGYSGVASTSMILLNEAKMTKNVVPE